MDNLDRKIKILCIGDPHFKISNIIEMTKLSKDIVEHAKTIKPDFIVCLGDVLDRHSNIHVTPLTLSTKFLKDLTLISELFIVIGNHDRPNNSNFCTDEHPFTACKYWNNCNVIDSPKIFHRYEHEFLFVPYVPPGRIREAFALLGEDFTISNITCVFAHQEFYGAKMEEGIVSKNGDHWPKTYPLCISGHIHHYDDLQPNLIYVGTPLQHEYSDTTDKSISLFTFDQNKDFIHDRIFLDLLRKYILYIRPQEIISYQPPDNVSLIMIITGTQIEIDACKKISRIKEFLKMGIQVKYKTILDSADNITDIHSNKINPVQTYLSCIYSNIEKENVDDECRQRILNWYADLFGQTQKKS